MSLPAQRAVTVDSGRVEPVALSGCTHGGEFYVPMATTEGTLVASYNRGTKLLHRAGRQERNHNDGAS